MKRLMPFALGIATVCLASNTCLWAADMLPGQVDFGAFSPSQSGGEFVEVNVPSSLISFGARLVEKAEPDVAKLLDGLKLVRVNVIGLDQDNRADMQKRSQKVRSDLTSKGWERIVTAQQKDQDVGIYMKLSDKGGVQGLVAVVLDGDRHAVFVNVVGNIRPEQLATLGEKLNIDPLKKIGKVTEKAHDKGDSSAQAEDQK